VGGIDQGGRVNLLSGKILVYRVFDIGADVNLEKVQKSFVSDKLPARFRLNKSSRAMIINNAPLTLTLDGGKLDAIDLSLDYDVAAKIWHFGAISITLQLTIPGDLPWEKLVQLSAWVETDERLHNLAVQRAVQLVQQFDPARLQNLSWETYEDYTIHFFKSLPGAETNALSVFQNFDVYRLILQEQTETLSEQMKRGIAEGALQYSQNDLAVINWNSALVIEPTGSHDIPDVIEFALCQLLEMRYYDDLLDEKLAQLYSALEKKNLSVWETYSEKLSKEAAQKYLEISDTIESVENSLKVVGDYYHAQVFRIASNRFRFNDWRDSVDQKLNNLAEISKLLTNEINERRNRLLEIVIIVLISIEVFPFIIRLFNR
jgi:hypothetical protein